MASFKVSSHFKGLIFESTFQTVLEFVLWRLAVVLSRMPLSRFLTTAPVCGWFDISS